MESNQTRLNIIQLNRKKELHYIQFNHFFLHELNELFVYFFSASTLWNPIKLNQIKSNEIKCANQSNFVRNALKSSQIKSKWHGPVMIPDLKEKKRPPTVRST